MQQLVELAWTVITYSGGVSEVYTCSVRIYILPASLEILEGCLNINTRSVDSVTGVSGVPLQIIVGSAFLTGITIVLITTPKERTCELQRALTGRQILAKFLVIQLRALVTA